MRSKHVINGLVLMLIVAPTIGIVFAIIGGLGGGVVGGLGGGLVGGLGGWIIGGFVGGIIGIVGFIVCVYGLVAGPIEVETKQKVEVTYQRPMPKPVVDSCPCPACGEQIAYYVKVCPSCNTSLKWQ